MTPTPIYDLLDFYNTEIFVGTQLIYHPHFITKKCVDTYTVTKITDWKSMVADVNVSPDEPKHGKWTEIPNNCAINYITIDNAMKERPEYFI